MINFPTPLPDEILYSVFARYHACSGNESIQRTLKDLFLNSNVAAMTAYTGQLYTLHTQIPGKAIPISYLIENHTLVPYYRPFIPENRYNQILHKLVHENCQSIYMRMGLPPSGVKNPLFLRYCSQCVYADRLNFGVAYWHRVHQLPGVTVCVEHQCCLLNSSIRYAQKEKKHGFIPIESILSSNIPTAIHGNHKEITIAQKSVDLLRRAYKPINPDVLRKTYLCRLQDMSFLTAGGNIRFTDLISRFNFFYSTTLLTDLGCTLNKNAQDTWLHKLLRKPRHSTHSLRHILAQCFLNVDMGELDCINQYERFSAFGRGPWPCLNKVAKHYKQKVINDVRVTRCSTTAKPVGTFQCDCGFIYSRRGPDNNEIDLYRIGRIKQLGAEWMIKLNELSTDSALSLREKARRLGVDPGTVKKYLDQTQFTGLTSVKNRRRKTNRKRLNKDDNQETYQRIDWGKRDIQLAQDIERTAYLLKSTHNGRISRAEITRQLQCTTMIHTKREKLPISRAMIEKVVETTEQYHERKRLMG